MRVLLQQLDGKLPNLALMRLSAHHKALGDVVELRVGANVEKRFDDEFEKVYASAIFRITIPVVERLLQVYPNVIVGGTAVDPPRKGELLTLSPAIQSAVTSVEDHGVMTEAKDYSLYPRFKQSIGFTQRGCRLRCEFCCVPQKEGAMRESEAVLDVWRGEGHARELILLDNDFFGQPNWRERVQTIRDGDFKVSFNQGINARFLTDEAAEAIASLKYRNDAMTTKRIYTAWDNLKDEQRLFDGLSRLVKYGVTPDSIMVYVLIGYWKGETHADRDYRRRKLREFGARPYPMPFYRTKELVGFQRWVIGAYDKRIAWEKFVAANYQPGELGYANDDQSSLF